VNVDARGESSLTNRGSRAQRYVAPEEKAEKSSALALPLKSHSPVDSLCSESTVPDRYEPGLSYTLCGKLLTPFRLIWKRLLLKGKRRISNVC
jgi:hypothetical protein